MRELRLYLREGRLGRSLFGQMHPDHEPTDEEQIAMKRVGAARWQRKTEGWKMPCTVDKCMELRREFGSALKVDKDVSEWYKAALAERKEQIAISEAGEGVELEHVPAAFASWLKWDQRAGAKWIANLYRNSGLLAPEGGVGKTATVVAGIMERQLTGSILVVCPKISVKAVWGHELSRWAPELPVYLCRGSRARRQRAITGFMNDTSPTAVLVIVSEMLRVKGERTGGRLRGDIDYTWPELFDVDWNAVIVDESHRVLGAMDIVKGNLAAEGLRRLNYTPTPTRLAVTATPWGKGGRTESLFGTLHWLWPDEYPSRWNWLHKHFEINEDRVFIRGGRGASKLVRRVGGLKKGTTEADFFKTLGPRVLRYTMAEVSPAHAGLKNYIEVLCELDGLQERQYEGLGRDGEIAVEGGIITTTGPLDWLTRSRQAANGALKVSGGKVRYTGESAKIDRLMAILEDQEFAEGTGKIVVASQYNEFLDVVQHRLHSVGLNTYRLDGSTSEARREDMMNAFQGDPVFNGPTVTCQTCHVGKGRTHGAKCLAQQPRVFLLNSRAGGVSITLDAADQMFVLDEMYPPEAMEQLFWRIFRRGRVHEVFYYLFRSAGTIDEKIGHDNEAGRQAQADIMDGRRGLETVRELVKYTGGE